MEELNLTNEELNNFKEFNKGGFEGKILLYKPELLIKRFEPAIMPFLNMENKKYKLIEFDKMKLKNDIIAKPIDIVNVNGEFSGFTMKKYDAITINNIKDFTTNINLYIKLFKSLDYLHSKNIIIGDVKEKNIIVDKNNNPIFVDVDSMGINNIPQDHIDRGPAGTIRRIPGIYEKYNLNDYKSIDKLLLLACFIEKLTNNNHEFTTKIMDSCLSEDAKKILYNFVTDDYIDYGLDLVSILEAERKR